MTVQQSLQQGLQFFRQDQLNSAVRVWLRGLNGVSAPADEAPFWCWLGAALRRAGQPAQALLMHQQLLQEQLATPYWLAHARIQLGLDLLAQREPKLAQHYAQPPTAEWAQDGELLMQYAELQLGLADDRGAEQSLETAMQALDTDPLAVAVAGLHLLQLYGRDGQVSAARLQQVIARASGHVALLGQQAQREMWLLLGQACERLGQRQEAVQHFERALACPVSKPTPAKPRRLSLVEYKLRQMTSEIEIELLREKNAVQHQQVQQLEASGFRDEITGLYNPRYLAMRWHDLHAAVEEGGMLCHVSLGIDLFASISEVLGKDNALVCYHQVARVAQEACPADWILVASGAGAFDLLAANASRTAIEQFYARLQSAVQALDMLYLPEPLHLSAGAAFHQRGEARDILQLRANLALFLAQREQRNQICWDGEV
ncbi:tetratricopeptide repeat-containing diguanylate cyclase [Chitinibacter tainanensis]|uniref:tetratricopeptide repeat-containing diguanylate cyclase n=1 Tax=Chitinibacter tainanensis TaxID=230667 RepID=UPI000424BEAE|nr:GGDEF domain-containing protein [Chitinibacter tainanensis]